MGEPVLELRDVSKIYAHRAGEIRVLDGISQRFERAQSVAIVGPSGSGKSTLLTLLAGLDHPSSGQVMVLGQDVSAMSEQQLTTFRARHMGIVFQQFHLMQHLTALENVALPLEIARDPEAFSRARVALEDVGMGHRLIHFPAELSGGECQRVAIARALVTSPDVILADEPSGNLDDKTGRQVSDLLFRLGRKRGVTLILVTHNADLAAACKRRLQLNNGQLQDIL